ncbi:tRNA (guanosine(37)-N1)-methyltransferase TrmD [Thiohalomonas denitrificans]|uniref:tRNA (guanosine(37)-N1)-methyltransferase TrmD n=1 Tax=Thiohalomonas denitrificans TaxID=415747 RepID=UPI0029500797|nr:tRNA (guanosine(37)-N1)-methyltransferase TrmD [Thiohalomonas denitrificans]
MPDRRLGSGVLALRIDVMTLFPEMFEAVSGFGVTGRAVERGLLQLGLWNPRNYTHDRHRTVDDRPYGGGPGMVMIYPPLYECLQDVRHTSGSGRVIYLSPQGRPLTQSRVRELVHEEHLILLAGRYEGIDERFIEAEVDEELSVGDYVLSGGELGAMVVIDAVTRLIPGALGHSDSAEQDSFSDGLLDCPHYTRPEKVADREVPEVLRSGDHAAIERWRLKQALGRTWERRPDLLEQVELDDERRALLAEYRRETPKN